MVVIKTDPDRTGIFVDDDFYPIKIIEDFYTSSSRDDRLDNFGHNSYLIYGYLIKDFSHRGKLIETVRNCEDLHEDIVYRILTEVDVNELCFIFDQIDGWMSPFETMNEYELDIAEITKLKAYQTELMALIVTNMEKLENNHLVPCVAFDVYTPEYTLLDILRMIRDRKGDVVYWVDCMVSSVDFYRENLLEDVEE